MKAVLRIYTVDDKLNRYMCLKMASQCGSDGQVQAYILVFGELCFPYTTYIDLIIDLLVFIFTRIYIFFLIQSLAQSKQSIERIRSLRFCVAKK